MRTRSSSIVVGLFTLLALVLASQPARAQEPQLAGDIPDSGVALVLWGGGPVTDLLTAARGEGCSVRSLWASEAGSLIGYVVGAPDFANTAFLSLFPSAVLSPSTPLILVCAEPPELVMSDDFENDLALWSIPPDADPLLEGWTRNEEPGNAVLSCTPGAAPATLLASTTGTIGDGNVSVQLGFRLPSGQSGFTLHVKGAANQLDAYFVVITPRDNHYVVEPAVLLNRIADIVGVSDEVAVVDSDWHELEVLVVGDVINVRLDDQLVVAYTDADPLTGSEIGLSCGADSAQFDNVAIAIPERAHVIALGTE